MKELKVLLGIYFIAIVVLIACTKVATVPLEQTINLGKESAAISFISAPIIVDGKVMFSIQTTIGSKYSIQVTDISGDVKVKQGLTASGFTENIVLPLDKLGKGIYDLVILDVKGNEIKQPIIKK